MGLVVDGAGLLLIGGSAVVDGVGVAVVVAFGAALAVLACIVAGFAVALEVLADVGVELVDGLAVAVVVLAFADVDAVEDADELADELVVAVAVGGGSVLAVGSLVDGCGLGELLEVAVGVGVAVGEEVDCGSSWHCCTAPVEVASAAASSTG